MRLYSRFEDKLHDLGVFATNNVGASQVVRLTMGQKPWDTNKSSEKSQELKEFNVKGGIRLASHTVWDRKRVTLSL